MSDPVERSREFDAKEQEAGGPGAIVAGLVAGVHDLRLITRLTMFGLLFDFALTLAFGLLYLRADTNQSAIRDANRHLVIVDQRACEHANDNSEKMNSLISSLIEAVGQTPYLPAAEKARRIATYNAVRAGPLKC